ncbi:small ribosomal subunit protein uS11m [Genypterus blacodes]|uniref:small ribosomal subunit protein uS11m n=1 Tax=Genypterus blacodes TaxID=154954 RepID=UPI003F765C20
MYTFKCALFGSVGKVCRQLAVSRNAEHSYGLQRALCSSAVRLEESAASSTDSNVTSQDFSHLPPPPGQDCALRWAGKKFEELPIAHIKATYNNTHIQLTDSEGQPMVRTSCGIEGFKNSKKSTPIAAQTAGISAATKATAKGVAYVRVVIKGLGPGRQSAIKGLTMGGLEVVSITDNTPVPHNGCRPRKARRI